MRTVLFISNSARLECARYIKGISAFAEHRPWNVQSIGGPLAKGQVARLLSFWKPAGCIVQCGGGYDLPERLFGKTPVVYIDRSPDIAPPRCLLVTQDSRRIGEIAARELLSLDCEHYAFIDIPGSPYWSRERRESFADALAANGRTVSVFSGSGKGKLAAFIKGLPKPLGVFATNDAAAEPVFHACGSLGLSIPDDVAVLGVDNDEMLCEMMRPTLSTVPSNAESAGYVGAELLARKLDEPNLAGVHLTYSPGAICRRQSTMRLRRRDDRVLAALEALRKANGNLSLDEVFALLGDSRRNAEIRFKRATGQTVLDEIHALRITCAQALLASQTYRIGEVAHLCGFKSEATFRRVFSAQTGCSAREWQRRERLAHDA